MLLLVEFASCMNVTLLKKSASVTIIGSVYTRVFFSIYGTKTTEKRHLEIYMNNDINHLINSNSFYQYYTCLQVCVTE